MCLFSRPTQSVHSEGRSLPVGFWWALWMYWASYATGSPLTSLLLPSTTAARRTTSCQTEDSQTELLNLSSHTPGHNWPEQHDSPLDPLNSPHARKTEADLPSTKLCQKRKATPAARPASFSTDISKSLAIGCKHPLAATTEGFILLPSQQKHGEAHRQCAAPRLQNPIKVA